jgi:hypothetical protein
LVKERYPVTSLVLAEKSVWYKTSKVLYTLSVSSVRISMFLEPLLTGMEDEELEY